MAGHSLPYLISEDDVPGPGIADGMVVVRLHLPASLQQQILQLINNIQNGVNEPDSDDDSADEQQ